MRGSTAITIARALGLGLVVAGCAQLADLGAGTSVAGTSPEAGTAGPEGKTDENIDISPASLDFGDVACGTEPASKLITIHNKGSLPVSYKAKIPDGTSFRLAEGLEGTIAPKGTQTLSVFVNPHSAGENSADLFVTAGDALQPVHVTAKGTGATFELVQSSIAFGDVRKENGGPPVDVEVKNTGTEAASISGFTSSSPAFDVQWSSKPGAFTVPANGSATFKVALLGATTDDPAPLTATIKPNTTRFCGAPPLLTASGRRVTSEVTIGPADWGRQACDTTPNTKNITITNYAPQIVTYALIPAATSAFTIADPGPGTIAAAPSAGQPQTAVFKIVPKKLGNTAPLLDIKELLGIMLASTAPGVSGRRDLQMHVDTRGAIITIAPAALTFTSDGSKADSKTFKVTNDGNESMFMNWSFQRTSANGNGAWAYSPPGYVGAGGSANGSVDFKATETGQATATLTPSQPFLLEVPSCKPVAPITLTGTKP